MVCLCVERLEQGEVKWGQEYTVKVYGEGARSRKLREPHHLLKRICVEWQKDVGFYLEQLL